MRGKNFLKPIPVVAAALAILIIASLVLAYFSGQLILVAYIYLTQALLLVLVAVFVYLVLALLENDWGWWR